MHICSCSSMQCILRSLHVYPRQHGFYMKVTSALSIFISLKFHTFVALAEYIYKHFQLWCSELITWRVGQNLFKLWQQISFTCVQLLQILLLRQLLTRGDRWKCWKFLPERGRAVSVLRRSKFWETFGWPRIWGPSTIKETKFLIIQRQMRTPSNRQCFFFIQRQIVRN